MPPDCSKSWWISSSSVSVGPADVHLGMGGKTSGVVRQVAKRGPLSRWDSSSSLGSLLGHLKASRVLSRTTVPEEILSFLVCLVIMLESTTMLHCICLCARKEKRGWGRKILNVPKTWLQYICPSWDLFLTLCIRPHNFIWWPLEAVLYWFSLQSRDPFQFPALCWACISKSVSQYRRDLSLRRMYSWVFLALGTRLVLCCFYAVPGAALLCLEPKFWNVGSRSKALLLTLFWQLRIEFVRRLWKGCCLCLHLQL